MSQKFGPKHPDMLQLVQSITTQEAELSKAVESAAQTTYTDLLQAQSIYDQSKARLDELSKDVIELSKYQEQYDNLQHDLTVADSLYGEIMMTMEREQAKFNMEAPSYRIVDRAAAASQPSVPRVMMWISSGAVIGLICGLAMAFLVAFLDDRIKTAFDIESVVGLPLLGSCRASGT